MPRSLSCSSIRNPGLNSSASMPAALRSRPVLPRHPQRIAAADHLHQDSPAYVGHDISRVDQVLERDPVLLVRAHVVLAVPVRRIEPCGSRAPRRPRLSAALCPRTPRHGRVRNTSPRSPLAGFAKSSGSQLDACVAHRRDERAYTRGGGNGGREQPPVPRCTGASGPDRCGPGDR